MNLSSGSARLRGTLVLATLILLAAAFLRMYRLSSVPPGIAVDEGQIVWDAIRASQYGWFPAYNDTRAEPLQRYIQAALILVGGRTIFTARLVNVFTGMFTVALAYRAINSLFYWDRRRHVAALFGAGMIAVLANTITLTHFADRGTLMVAVMMAAVHFMAQAWRRGGRWWFVAAGFFFVGAVHTYTAAIFFPLALLLVLFHQALVNFPTFRTRVARLPYLLLGALPSLVWWLWQFAQPGSLYWRSTDIGAWQEGGIAFFTQQLPGRLLATTQGFYLYGDCDPQFNVWSKPLLNPLLFALALIGLAMILTRFRRLEAGVLLILLPVQLLPIALTTDVVHGRRIAGEFLVVAALAGLAVMVIWDALSRRSSPRWAAPVGGLALAGLLAGTGADSLGSYLSYLTVSDPGLMCDGSPMDPYYYYLTEHVELARYLSQSNRPVYLPVEELENPAVHVALAQTYPHVVTYSSLLGPGGNLSLPDGDVVVWPGQEYSAHYVLLLPAGGQIVLLPGLSPDRSAMLETALLQDGEILTGSHRRLPIGRRLALSADFNPFAGLQPPPTGLIAAYDNGMQLVGVDAPFVVEPGQTVAVTLYWQVARWLPNDYFTSVTLVDPQGQGVANSFHWTMRWVYATAQWQPGSVIPDGHILQLPPNMSPGVYRLRVGIAAEAQNPQSMPAVGPGGEPLGDFFLLNYAKVPFPEPPPIPSDATRADINVGGLVLEGYTVTRDDARIDLSEASPGDTLTFTFFWRVPDRLPGVYHFFIHVQQSPEGEVLASFDGPPLGDIYPTIVWGPDERIVTTHTLTLPDVDGLEFRIGFYEWPSLVRLPVIQDGVSVPDNRAVLWPPSD